MIHKQYGQSIQSNNPVHQTKDRQDKRNVIDILEMPSSQGTGF